MARFRNETIINSKLYILAFFIILAFFTKVIQSSLLDEKVLEYADDALQELLDRYEKSDSYDFWHPNSFKTGTQSREVVKISSVSKRILPGNYKQWKYSQVGTGTIIAGLSSHWIDFYNENLRLVATINTTETFVALATFSEWNERLSKSELVVIVATEKPSLNAYILTNDNIFYPGSWPLHNRVKSLELCVVDMSRKIIVVPHDDKAPVDIYNFETRNDTSELWFFQRLNVGTRSCLTVHEIQSSSCSIAVADETKISVYQYETQLGLFYEQHQFKNMSTSCKQLISFSLAYTRYLALVPTSPNQTVEFLSETGRDIAHQHYAGIQAVDIVPLPVSDYRNEDILLVRTPFNSTKIYSYDGQGKLYKETFACTPDICSVSENTPSGVGILVNGTTVYFAPTQAGQNYATVLIIQSKVENYLSPLYERSRQLYDEFRSLSELYKRFKQTVVTVVAALEDSLSQSEPNIITGNWDMKDLSSYTVFLRDHPQDSNHTKMQIGQNIGTIEFIDTPLRGEDFVVQDSETELMLNNLQSLVKNAEHVSIRTIPRDSQEVVQITAPQNIKAHITSTNIESERLLSPAVNDVDRVEEFFSGFADRGNPSKKIQILSPVKINGKIIANNLHADKVNNIPTDHFAYLSSKNIFNSTIAFEKQLAVVGNTDARTVSGLHIPQDIILATDVQGVTFKNDIVALKNAEASEEIGSIRVNREFQDSIFLRDGDQDINSEIQFAGIVLRNDSTTVNLNDQNFASVAHSIVVTDHAGLIRGTKTVVNHNAVANSLTINNFLNSVHFPDGYLQAHENDVVIYGFKNFSHIAANSVALQGTINNIATDNVVRLDGSEQPYHPSNWTLYGPVTFNGNVNVKETVGGTKISDLYFGDTLDMNKRQYFPNHNIRFDFPIQVEELHVEEKLNQKPFNESCGDVLICEDHVDLVVRGLTTLNSGGAFSQLNIGSKKINNIPLESILDRNTEQNITKAFIFTQPMGFEKLIALSEVDGVHLPNMLENAILLNQDQILPPGLSFESVYSHAPVSVSGAVNEFNDFRNEVAVKHGRSEQVFESSLEVADLEVEDLSATTNLAAFKPINGFDLSRWMTERVTLSEDATLYEPVEILGDTVLEKNVQTKVLNGESLRFLNTKVLRKDKSEQTFSSPVVIYGSMIVQQNAVVHKTLNGYNVEDIIRDSIPIAGEQVENITVKWSIERPIFHKLFVHGATCNVDIKVLDRDSVKENETNVMFQGETTIEGSLSTLENIDTHLINGVELFSKIFTLSTPQAVNRDIIWKSDVIVNNLLEVQGTVNGVLLPELKRIYSYRNGTHNLRFDVNFDSAFQANHFVVRGLIQKENLRDFLATSVQLHADDVQTVHGNFKFEQPIVSEGNVFGETINGVPISRLADAVIRKNSDFTFTNRVFFEHPVTVETLTVDAGDVVTHSNQVGEIDIGELQSNSIPLFPSSDHPVFMHSLSFKDIAIDGNLDGIHSINGIPWDDFVTRNTQQNMNSLRVHNLNLKQGGINVKGLFGNVNVLDAVANTLMTSEQVDATTGPKTFTGTVTVEGNLITAENSRLSELVHMNEASNVTSQLSFPDLFIVTGDVTLDGKWNGYSMDDLRENGLSSLEDDVISGEWNYGGGVVFRDATVISGLIDGVNVTQLDRESRQRVLEAETSIEKQELIYSHVCQDLQALYKDASKSPLKLQSFDEQQVLVLQGTVENMLTVTVGQNIFLLVASGACGAVVYKWSTSSEIFYESGLILPTELIFQWSQVSQLDSAIIVFDSTSSSCTPVSESGLYFTQANSAGDFSAKVLINSGAVVDFKLVTSYSTAKTSHVTLLFAVFEEYAEVINVLSWSSHYQAFTPETTVNISSPIAALDVNELESGNFAILLKTHSQVSIHIYSTQRRILTQLNSVEVYGVPKLLKLFQADSALFAVISTLESEKSKVKPSSNLQLFEATRGDLRWIQTLTSYDTVAIEVVTISNQVFVLVLTKPVGLYVYKFMGLSGLQSVNEYPLKFNNGEVLNAFYVTPWHYNTTLPFVLVSSRNVVKLLHSNVIGNAVIDSSQEIKVSRMCDFTNL